LSDVLTILSGVQKYKQEKSLSRNREQRRFGSMEMARDGLDPPARIGAPLGNA
jgi:hypothetical protein